MRAPAAAGSVSFADGHRLRVRSPSSWTTLFRSGHSVSSPLHFTHARAAATGLTAPNTCSTRLPLSRPHAPPIGWFRLPRCRSVEPAGGGQYTLHACGLSARAALPADACTVKSITRSLTGLGLCTLPLCRLSLPKFIFGFTGLPGHSARYWLYRFLRHHSSRLPFLTTRVCRGQNCALRLPAKAFLGGMPLVTTAWRCEPPARSALRSLY